MTTPTNLAFEDGRLEEVVQKKILQIWVLIKGLLDVAKETATEERNTTSTIDIRIVTMDTCKQSRKLVEEKYIFFLQGGGGKGVKPPAHY